MELTGERKRRRNVNKQQQYVGRMSINRNRWRKSFFLSTSEKIIQERGRLCDEKVPSD